MRPTWCTRILSIDNQKMVIRAGRSTASAGHTIKMRVKYCAFPHHFHHSTFITDYCVIT
jgi:hypothetical protein